MGIPDANYYEVVVIERLEGNRRRYKKFRFMYKPPDLAKEEFLKRHPEFNDLKYQVGVRDISNRLGCCFGAADILEIESNLEWYLGRTEDPRQRRRIAKFLVRFAKKIEDT